MRIEKTGYGDKQVDHLKDAGLENKFATFEQVEDSQPEIGMYIGWNEPKKFWKPFLYISLWRVNLRIGWLWESA